MAEDRGTARRLDRGREARRDKPSIDELESELVAATEAAMKSWLVSWLRRQVTRAEEMWRTGITLEGRQRAGAEAKKELKSRFFSQTDKIARAHIDALRRKHGDEVADAVRSKFVGSFGRNTNILKAMLADRDEGGSA